MTEIKLKPCPFCGQTINLIEGNVLFGWHKPNCFWHYLDDGKISAMSQEELTSEAIKAWNNRADTRNESQPVLDDGAFGACPNCEYEFNSELRNEYEIRYCPNCGQKLDWRTDNGNGMDQR